MPFTDLGLPLETTRPIVQDLLPLVCRAERKITATMNLPSYASKLSLLNSLITSLAIYAMCTIKIHPQILAQLDKIRRFCLWNKKTESGDKCNSLAAWDMVCHPKCHGGLGVLNIQVQNEALLMKFLHNFYNRHDIPWVKLVWNTYYSSKIPHATEPCGSFWWRDVLQFIPMYRGITTLQINCGTMALFWKDSWLHDIISETHPRAYSYTACEDIFVHDFLTITDLSEAFHLPLSIQAREEVRQLQAATLDTDLSTQSKDVWMYVWGAQNYKAKDYYAFYFRNVPAHEAFGWLWKSKSIPKIKVFGWLLLSGRLNTRNMLKRRHYNIGNNLDFLLCGNHTEETMEHLFFQCPFSAEC